MYELLTESKQAIQSYTIDGTIGEIEFSEEEVLKGSLSLSKLCTGSSEFRLGGGHIGQLNISFVGMNIARNSWKGKEIDLTINIDDKEIPIGKYTVDNPTHSRGIVAVTAYDNMAKFDKPCGTDAGTNGFPYDLLALACQSCGVTFGMSRSEVEALPNGNKTLILNTMGDIETWRDYIYWIAVTLCSFATVDRDGSLIVNTFHNTVDDTIPSDSRFNTSTYNDEVITYTGVTIYVEEDKATEYYHAAVDNGYTLNIGNNPFFQVSKIMREEYMANIVAALSNIQFNSCSVKVPFGFHYDLGDVLQFPNGQGSATNKFCVMGMSLKYNGECVLSGIPGIQKNSMSKTDKNLQGLMSSVSKNEFTSYEQRNVGRITIGNNDEERLIIARIVSNNSTKAQIHIEVNLESVAVMPTAETEDFADIWGAISNTAVKGVVRYLINSEEYDFKPTETFIDGKHVLHLMYILPLEANILNIFEVYMRSIGGTITIPPLGVWFYASGAGLVGDGKWDGNVNFQDDVETWDVIENTFENATDSIVINSVAPETFEFTEASIGWDVIENSFENAVDDITATFHTDVFRRITEDGDIRITEDGDVRYTEGD